MKGDEVVKSGEERTDGLLLSLRFRKGHHGVMKSSGAILSNPWFLAPSAAII